MRYNGMHYGGMTAGWVIFCTIAVIAIAALVAWAIVASTHRRDTRDDRAALRPDALGVLERRFASGDIDEGEYQRRRNLLVQH